MKEEKMPVRVVTSQPNSRRRKPGGGPKKLFCNEEEIPKRQEFLLKEVGKVQDYFEKSFQEYPSIPHVSKVQLVEDAIAKSHRPAFLFSADTCPIIGAGQVGQLFVRTETQRLHYLENKIKQKPTKNTNTWQANISAISTFDPFTERDRLDGQTPESLVRILELEEKFTIKVRLFDFFDRMANINAKKGFVSLVNHLHLQMSMVGERSELRIWKIDGITIESLEKLVTFPAIRELSLFPRYSVVQPSRKIHEPPIHIPRPESKDYPVVGLLDTGIPENHPLIPWIVESTNFVSPEFSNRRHGSSVAALLVMAHHFNDLDVNDDFLKIVNVEILGNTEENVGKVDRVYEDDLIERIENYFENRDFGPKIWNKSLGFKKARCEFRRFSDLAVFLDKLQDRHSILFVLPSGNYEEEPFRTWPSQIGEIEIREMNDEPFLPPDYLSKPAECVRAVTVGAITCAEKETSLVRRGQPASYSRKGPGPSFIPKPEVVHYSGNISILENGNPDSSGQGIKSVDEEGQIIDCAGTSYAVPLVSRTLALLEHFIEPSPSPLLLKALLIHNSRILESFDDQNCFYYVGFGIPEKAIDVVFCSPYEITLIFENRIHPRATLVYPFCWPDSLKNGEKIAGEVKATLVSAPPLDDAFGAEYIRADVRFSLQSRTMKKGKMKWKGIVPEDPHALEVRKRYESSLIREAFKWSPVKKYYKRLSFTKTEELRVKIDLFLRDGPDMVTFDKEVDFALILTLRDPKRRSPVYDEIIAKSRSLGLLTEEIQLREKVREIVRKKT